MSSQSNNILRYVKLTENALPPTRRSPKAADIDLRSPYDATILARGKVLIKTDLHIKLPDSCYDTIAALTV
jgi:dUTPase